MQGPMTHDSESRRDKTQLEELLECERHLTELMVEARVDAARRIEEARAAASAQEADLEASLGMEADRLRAAVRERTQASVREIRAEAEARVTGFDGITDEQVTRLADHALRILIRPGSAP